MENLTVPARGMVAVDRLAELERGEKEPTRPTLVKMARHYRRPLLAFYLTAPPQRGDRGADFRTLPVERSSETDALVDALVRNVRSQQNMVRAALEAGDEAEPLPFVGALSRSVGARTDLESLSNLLRRRTDAARSSRLAAEALSEVLGHDLNAATYYAQPSADQAFTLLRTRTEGAGVFVLLKGNLGSHHRQHLRTSNVVESPFAALRLRTDAAKRFKKVESATAAIFKLLLVAQRTGADARGLPGRSLRGRREGNGVVEGCCCLSFFTHLLTRTQLGYIRFQRHRTSACAKLCKWPVSAADCTKEWFCKPPVPDGL